MMINALHLLWIIPLSAIIGIFTASLMHASADADRRTNEMLKRIN